MSSDDATVPRAPRPDFDHQAAGGEPTEVSDHGPRAAQATRRATAEAARRVAGPPPPSVQVQPPTAIHSTFVGTVLEGAVRATSRAKVEAIRVRVGRGSTPVDEVHHQAPVEADGYRAETSVAAASRSQVLDEANRTATVTGTRVDALAGDVRTVLTLIGGELHRQLERPTLSPERFTTKAKALAREAVEALGVETVVAALRFVSESPHEDAVDLRSNATAGWMNTTYLLNPERLAQWAGRMQGSPKRSERNPDEAKAQLAKIREQRRQHLARQQAPRRPSGRGGAA